MQLAEVRADLCASCGICVGSCLSSTVPQYRGMHTGIDMPQWPIDDLRARLLQGLAAMPGPRRLVVLAAIRPAQPHGRAGCPASGHGVQACCRLPLSSTHCAEVPTACSSTAAARGCEFRLGQRWTQQRLNGEREPHLRTSVLAERWRVVWTDPGDESQLVSALEDMRTHCAPGALTHFGEHPMNRDPQLDRQALLYGSFALVVGVFALAQLPSSGAERGADQGQLHSPWRADRRMPPHTAEELSKLAPNMRAPMKCERERSPVRIEVEVDGVSVYAHTATPSGFARRRLHGVPAAQCALGEHRITVRMKDNMKSPDFPYVHDSTVTLQPAQVMVIDFNPDKGEIVLL